MTGQHVIPALTLREPGGSLDQAATTRYAERAARTHADFFLLSGSTGLGWQSSHAERRYLISAWADAVGRSRLIACCWDQDDLAAAHNMGVRPILVLRDFAEARQVISALAAIPKGGFVYSHPRYSAVTFTPHVAAQARDNGCLPSGAKVSKVTLAMLTELRAATDGTFTLWDGSSRHIKRSMTAGASGVVIACLAHLPDVLFQHEPDRIQRSANAVQRKLDRLPSLSAKVELLTRSVRRHLGQHAYPG